MLMRQFEQQQRAAAAMMAAAGSVKEYLPAFTTATPDLVHLVGLKQDRLVRLIAHTGACVDECAHPKIFWS
jgi:hypothetical protein